MRRGASPQCNSCALSNARSCTVTAGLLGWARAPQFPIRSPHAASGRLLFLAAIPVGLYRSQIVPGRRKYLRSQGDPQAGGAGRSVLGDRRVAADEAPSGAAALSDGRAAAL